MKGIRVGVMHRSRYGFHDTPHSYRRRDNESPNCNSNWQEPSECPTDMVVVKVRVFFGPLSGVGAKAKRQITGLRAICSPAM